MDGWFSTLRAGFDSLMEHMDDRKHPKKHEKMNFTLVDDLFDNYKLDIDGEILHVFCVECDDEVASFEIDDLADFSKEDLYIHIIIAHRESGVT